MQWWPAENLVQLMHSVRRQVRDGAELTTFLPDIFAAGCVAAGRALSLHPYDVQLLGAIELHHGRIAEMATGEGKTLVAALPAALRAVTGRGVHVVTVNDYLARRDAALLEPVYNMLGLTVGVIVSGKSDEARRAAYRCDVVYATNKELGFDFLRDQIKQQQRGRYTPIDTQMILQGRTTDEPVMRQLHYALVDEADSILIDEARTPLIIAGPAEESPLAWAYAWADHLAQRLRPRHDFELKVDQRKLEWTEPGRGRLLALLEKTQTPSVQGASWQELVLRALRARWLFIRDQHYVVQEGDAMIIDEFTGRQMPGRTWSEGIQQAVQAKEGLTIKARSQTLARTTYQHFFRLYGTLAGMTGTARAESREFAKVYKTPVAAIPTHRPVRRKIEPALVFRTRHEKWRAVVAEVREVGRAGGGRPVLVGTHSVEDSETLSMLLKEKGVRHQVLNARPAHAAAEAKIVAAAGQVGAVTIATNMAGRGTDIKVSPAALELGGLHVIGTQMHESERVDRQLMGRCARQGDLGSFRFILSLQDPLLAHTLDRRRLARLRRRLRGPFGAPVEARALRLFRVAQLKVEGMHYRLRQQLMDYEDWLNRVYYEMRG
jgi:preprotein translocase subunit SecA